MTHRPGRFAAALPSNAVWRTSSRRFSQTGAAIGDRILAVLIVLAAIFAWAPRLGIAAAREAIAARREARARLAEIVHIQSAVWARQARRNALERQRNVTPSYRRTSLDP